MCGERGPFRQKTRTSASLHGRRIGWHTDQQGNRSPARELRDHALADGAVLPSAHQRSPARTELLAAQGDAVAAEAMVEKIAFAKLGTAAKAAFIDENVNTTSSAWRWLRWRATRRRCEAD
jgi:hypothetical protein